MLEFLKFYVCSSVFISMYYKYIVGFWAIICESKCESLEGNQKSREIFTKDKELHARV